MYPFAGLGNKASAKRGPRRGVTFADPRSLDLKNLVKLSGVDGRQHKLDCIEEPCILHYPCCGLFWLRSKYDILGEFPGEWAQLRTGQAKGNICEDKRSARSMKIQPSFHLDAREAASVDRKQRNAGKSSLRNLFEQQVLLSDSEQSMSLIKAGVCRRMFAVQKILAECVANCDGEKRKQSSTADAKADGDAQTNTKVNECLDHSSSEETQEKVHQLLNGVIQRKDVPNSSEKKPTGELENTSVANKKDNGNEAMLDKSWLLAQISKQYLSS